MSRLRIALATALGIAVTATLTTPTMAARRASSRDGDLSFRAPVAMRSFSPSRTAVSAIYSLRRGEEPERHEWSGEPVISVNNFGDVFIGGTCCLVAASPVWVSRNNGRSFRELRTPAKAREWGIGAEGTIAVDDAGSVYFVDTYVPGLLVTRWHDRGRTWDFTMQAAGVIPGFDDRPWITYSDENLYLYVNHVTHTQIYRSPDGGITWLTEGPLTWNGSASAQPYFPGHIAANRETGELWVGGIVNDDIGQYLFEPSKTLASAVTRDGGKTYRRRVVTKLGKRRDFSPIFTGIMAVDDAGNGYVAWSTYDRNECDVYYAVSTNHGRSWRDPVQVNSGPGCATFPWIDAGADGRLALVWYETRQTKMTKEAREDGLAFQDGVPEKTRWYLHAATVLDAHGKNPRIDEARVPHPTPVIEGPIQRKPWDFMQVEIGPDGRMHIAYSEKWRASAPETWYAVSVDGARLK